MNWLTNSTTDWSQLLAFLVDCALKGSVVIIVAAIAARLLRRHTAAARHTVWSAAAAAQLVIPVLTTLLPTWRVPVLDEPAWVTTPTTTVSATPNGTPTPPAPSNVQPTQTSATGPESNVSARTAPASTTPSWRPSPVMVLAALWMLGCIAVLVRLAAGTAVVSRMAGRGERVIDEKWLGLLHRLAVGLRIRRPLTLLRGDALAVPVTWGIVYPVVLLPNDADSWPEERRRYVLVHEMAHVKRLDAFTQLITQFALAIFWFNPLVWVTAREMRRERENACDDYVLTHGTKPSEYATDLLELVRGIDTDDHRSVAPAFAALAMARRSEFEGRMLSILDPRIRRNGLTRKGLVMSLITAFIVVVPLAAFSPFSPMQAAPVAELLPDSVKSFDVAITPAKPQAPPDSATPAVIQSPTRTGGQRTESYSSGGVIEPCNKVSNSVGTATSIRDDSDSPDTRTVRFIQRTSGRCVEAMLIGAIRFSDDDRAITGINRGAQARFHEVQSGVDREMIVTSEAGQPRHEYTVNGKTASYDEEGRDWLASIILTIVRESAYNAPQRVRRLEQQGGVNRVLTEISAIQSTGAKRSYYEGLLALGNSLSDSSMTRLFTQIRSDLGESSSDMRSVLLKVSPHTIRTTQVRAAFASAIADIDSDGDKSSLLQQLAMTAERDVLIDIMGVAFTIGSDGDKARLLMVSAARYLGMQDQQLREAYFKVVDSIGSDGDRMRVLISAAAYGNADEAVTEAAIRSTLAMDSDGDIANVLTSIASRKLLTTTKIKDAYMTAARHIDSDGDRARVLRAAIIIP